MSHVTVHKIQNEKTALVKPFFSEIEKAFDAIRLRAFELFERRGGVPGNEMEDWLAAERELFWVPQAEMAENGKEFKMEVAVPGFDAGEVKVTAVPGEIIVKANAEKRNEKEEEGICYSEFGSKSLYRRFDMSTPIDVDKVTATIEKGMLTIVAPKMAAQPEKKLPEAEKKTAPEVIKAAAA